MGSCIDPPLEETGLSKTDAESREQKRVESRERELQKKTKKRIQGEQIGKQISWDGWKLFKANKRTLAEMVANPKKPHLFMPKEFYEDCMGAESREQRAKCQML